MTLTCFQGIPSF
uniref:Uncharacterized protein n=1 Tax=Anopheles quadriannulatus TaxID=34691 RepID=A0A182XTQ5_ANOQN